MKLTRSGCCVAPARQRRGPLLRAAELVDLLTALDHAAIDEPGDERGQLARGDRDHRLVEQREARLALPELRQGAAMLMARERDQVGVAEALADAGRGDRGRRTRPRSRRQPPARPSRARAGSPARRTRRLPRRRAAGSARASPAAGASEPSSRRCSPIQKAQRAAGSVAPAARCAWCARSNAATYSSSRPSSEAAVASSSRSRGCSGVRRDRPSESASYALSHSRRAWASRRTRALGSWSARPRRAASKPL